MRRGRPVVSWLAGLTLATQLVSAAEPGAPRRGASAHQLIGRVVKSAPGVVYLEHMGAIVPLKITKGTAFRGLPGKTSRDLSEGQQVLATFTVEERTTNVAKSISATSEAIAEPRSSTPPAPAPGRPPDLPGPPDHGPTVPRVPPEQPLPRDPGAPR